MMLKNKKIIALVIGLVGGVTLVSFMVFTGQAQSQSQKIEAKVLRKGESKDRPPKDKQLTEKELDDAATPIVDLANLGNPMDNQRKAKNSFFNNADFVKKAVAPNVATISKDVSGKRSDLPANESDVIVEGKVMDSQAFLSDDGTGIYSEFSIKISEIVRSNINIEKNALLTGERFGGRVRYPNGQIVRYKLEKRGSPTKGKTYLFFLKNKGTGNFTILTAYEFRGNNVFPLDGSRITGLDFGSSKYDKHTGKNIQQFKQEVGKAIKGGKSMMIIQKLLFSSLLILACLIFTFGQTPTPTPCPPNPVCNGYNTPPIDRLGWELGSTVYYYIDLLLQTPLPLVL